jgi:hypothetical protein
MARFTSLLLCTALVLGALVCLCLLPARWLAPAGLDVGGAPATMRRYSEQLERGERLEQARRDAQERIEVRQRVVREVIGRHLSLAEAAARFQELDLASPTFNWEQFRAETLGATDEERQCRAVIRHVRTALADDPGRVQAEGRRLEAELQLLLNRHGHQ